MVTTRNMKALRMLIEVHLRRQLTVVRLSLGSLVHILSPHQTPHNSKYIAQAAEDTPHQDYGDDHGQ